MRMFNRKTGMFCTLLFCIFMTTGCENAPKRGQNDDLKEETKASSEQYVSVEEAKNQLHELEGKNMEGIYLPKHIWMPDIQKVSEVKLTPWYSKQREDLETAIKSMWSDYGKVDWASIKEKTFTRPDDADYYGSQKEDKKTGFLYSYGSEGFFSGDSLDDTELTCDSCVKGFDFEWGDAASEKDVYELEDGETSVPEAVSYTEALFNENLSGLEKGRFAYKVQHLYVIKNEDTGYYDFNMVIGRVYKGICIDTSSCFTFFSEGKSYDKTHGGIHMIAIMRHKNSIDLVNICTELLNIEKETEKEKIISPIWAVQQLNKEIAHGGGISFSDCGLVYLLVQDNRLAGENRQDVTQFVNETTYLRPVWLFMSAGSGTLFETMTQDSHGTSVVVDALDGTLYYYDGTGAY